MLSTVQKLLQWYAYFDSLKIKWYFILNNFNIPIPIADYCYNLPSFLFRKLPIWTIITNQFFLQQQVPSTTHKSATSANYMCTSMWKILKMKFDNFMNTCSIINSSYNIVDWKLSFKILNHLLLLSQLQATICAGNSSSLTHQFSQHFMLIRAECQVCNHYILNHSTNFGEIRCCLAACLHTYVNKVLSAKYFIFNTLLK